MSALRSVREPDVRESELTEPTPARKKPPKSLRVGNSSWQASAVEPSEAQLRTEAALLEELLGEDTVAIGASAPPLLDAELAAATEQAAAPAASARRWPGPRRKCVTISVRLSAAEAKTLRRRADESELSVSDYLRSCVLEADQLRAQVKQVLAEVRTRRPEAQASAVGAAEPLRAESSWRERRWRRWLAALRLAQPMPSPARQPMPSHR